MKKEYLEFVGELKKHIIQSRYAAAKLVNKEQLVLYFNIGRMLEEKVKAEKWGAGVLERIAEDLQKQLPGLRGFSATNLKNMRMFYEGHREIGQTVSGQIGGEGFWSISFSHHLLLLAKCKTVEERVFYIEKAAAEYWSLRVLDHHIHADMFRHRGKLSNNFGKTLEEKARSNALDVFKDEYLFDFVSLDEDDEKVLEGKLVADVKNMIMTLGKGFCFIGNQYRLEVEGEEFFVDLLFFNRHLQCLVAFELKRGKFMPAYAGQLNFYLEVLDERVRQEQENPSIGIILCKEKNNTVVEFAVRSIDKAMGVATYKTTKEMPGEMRGILPDADALARLL